MLCKKGDLEIKYIIVFILGLVVLFALLYVFRSQLSHFVDVITRIGGQQNVPSIETVVGG